MAKEKKTQTSEERKKAAQAKNKQGKSEKTKVEETNVQNKSGNKSTSNKKNKEQVLEKKKVDNKMKEVITKQSNDKDNSKKKRKVETQEKKVKNKNENVAPTSVVSSDEMGKLIKIILILIVIVVAFYGLTVLITKFQKTSVPDRNKNTTPAVIQYDEILIGTMLNQAREEYYVLIQKDDDQYQTLTSYYLQRYNSTTKPLKVYIANINSVYNQFYISENSNIKTNNISEFKVSTITLVKVKNHEIVEAYEGLEEIEKAFKALLEKKEK